MKNLITVLFRSAFIFFPIVLFTSACGSTAQFSPPLLERPVTVDGNLSDWNTSESLIESRDDANFYATYDEESLYLFIDIRGAQKDRAIRQSGFIIYLSDSEDMRKKTGIAFPAGTFNLLRGHPGQHSAFLRESDWMSKPENRELLNQLENELFDRAMIVERPDGRSNAEYGFVELSQLEVDGLEIAVNEESRYLSIEMKIPRNGRSIYELSNDRLWLGFAIETPNFRQQNQSDYSSDVQSRNRTAYGNRQQRAPSRQNIARSLGEFERWYKINIE